MVKHMNDQLNPVGVPQPDEQQTPQAEPAQVEPQETPQVEESAAAQEPAVEEVQEQSVNAEVPPTVPTPQPVQQSPAAPQQPASFTPPAPPQQGAAPFVNTYTPPVQPQPYYTGAPAYQVRPQPTYQPPIARPPFVPFNPAAYPPTAAPVSVPGDQAVEQQRRASSKRGFRVLCAVLAAVMILSVGGAVGFLAGNHATDSKEPSDGQTDITTPGGDIDINLQHGSSPDSAALSIAQVNEKVSPSVVVINVYSKSDPSLYGYCSGVIFSEDGYIITNDHVFEDCPDPIMYITTYDEKTYRASFVAGDARWDIAILKIEAKGLTPATFGYSSELIVGQQVVAIGNASGMAFTVSSGIVSALDRRVSDSDGYSSKYIQTTAPISGGSSGGALANIDGQIVGITSGKLVGDTVEGICFAIPSDKVLSMVSDLLKNGHITTRGKLGITYQEINQAAADLNDLQVGLCIYSVSEESSLYKKLQKDDIITKVNGKSITSGSVMLDAIEAAKPGDKLTLTVLRQGKELQAVATILADKGSSNYQKDDELQPLYPDTDKK